MAKQRYQLPKEGLTDPEGRARPAEFDDVEGHGIPLTPPPSIGSSRPGHGGENIPTVDEDDVEGHRRRE